MLNATVIAIGGDIADGVAERLLLWRSNDLLRDFVLLDETAQVSEKSPIRRGDSPLETLLAELGVQNVDLLVVRPSWDDPGVLDQLVQRLRRVSADPTVTKALGLTATNLVCPLRAALDGETEWQVLGSSWDHNIIVAPEDRVEERAITPNDDSLDALSARAAFSVALLAGLLPGMETVPVTRLNNPANAVRAIRCFGRVVVGPPTFLDNLRSDLDGIRVDETHMAECVGGLPSKEPEHQILESATAFSLRVNNGALTFSAYQPDSPPVPTKVTWREALRMLVTFMGGFIRGQIRRLTTEAAERARRKAQERVNRMVFGEGSAYKLVLPLDPGDPAPVTSVAQQLLSNDTDGAVFIPPQPQVWQELRCALFALVDGSAALPYLPSASFNDQSFVVAQPALLAPLADVTPGLAAEALGDKELPVIQRACDAASAMRRRQVLKALDHSSDKDAATPNDEGTHPVSNPLLRQLDTWEEPRKKTFTYIVARHLAMAVVKAEVAVEADLARLKALAQDDQPDAETSSDSEPAKARRLLKKKRLLRSVLVATFVVLVVAAPLVGLLIGLVGVIVWIVLQVAALLFAALHLLSRWLKRLQREFQEANRLRLEAWEAEQAVAAALHDSTELLRLSARYDELVEWSDVLAAIIHFPFSQRPDRPKPADVTLSGPLSLSVADATVGSARRERLSSQLGAKVFERGWLTRLFAESADKAIETLQFQHAQPDRGQGLDADYDVGAKRGDISRLGGALENQDRGALLDSAVASFVGGLPSEELFEPQVTNRRTSQMEDIRSFLQSIQAGDTVTPFDASLSGMAAQDDLRQVIDPPTTWGLRGNARLGLGVVDETGQKTFRMTWRLDISEPTLASHLRMPAQDQPEELDDPVALPET